jgi:hypothetical protein
MLATEYVEVQFHALQTMTEQFQLCDGDNVVLKNCIVARKQRLVHGMHLITQNVYVRIPLQ